MTNNKKASYVEMELSADWIAENLPLALERITEFVLNHDELGASRRHDVLILTGIPSKEKN